VRQEAVNPTALRENRIEAVACMLPTLDHIMDGIHVVQALGHDCMTVNIGVKTEQAGWNPTIQPRFRWFISPAC
jgi:hypothetical protein